MIGNILLLRKDKEEKKRLDIQKFFDNYFIDQKTDYILKREGQIDDIKDAFILLQEEMELLSIGDYVVFDEDELSLYVKEGINEVLLKNLSNEIDIINKKGKELDISLMSYIYMIKNTLKLGLNSIYITQSGEDYESIYDFIYYLRPGVKYYLKDNLNFKY